MREYIDCYGVCTGELVRCRDCNYFLYLNALMPDGTTETSHICWRTKYEVGEDDYCSNAKRKKDE